MIGYFKKDNKKDDMPVIEEVTNADVLDCSVGSIDHTPIGYYSITQDPCEPYIVPIVNVLKERFRDVGSLNLIDLPIDLDLTTRMDLDAAYAYSEVVSGRVRDMLDIICSNKHYQLYKKACYSIERLDAIEDIKLTRFYESVSFINSEMLRDALVKNAIVGADCAYYVYDAHWVIFNKMYSIEKQLSNVLSRMEEVKKEYISTRMLSKELDLIGREYKNISRLDLNGVFGNVPDGVLPVVNVVITETGVHLCWDIRLDSKCDLKITSDGMLMYPVGSDWLALKGYYAIHRKMSYLMGNVSSLIKQKIGKSVKVTSIGLANNNVKEIMNYSNRKVIKFDTLYDTVYDDADRGELSVDEIEEVYKLLASLNAYDHTVDVVDVSEEMLAMWETNIKFLDDAIVARGLIKGVLEGDKTL